MWLSYESKQVFCSFWVKVRFEQEVMSFEFELYVLKIELSLNQTGHKSFTSLTLSLYLSLVVSPHHHPLSPQSSPSLTHYLSLPLLSPHRHSLTLSFSLSKLSSLCLFSLSPPLLLYWFRVVGIWVWRFGKVLSLVEEARVLCLS